MPTQFLSKIDVHAGRMIEGYRLTECIGVGGFAEVWSAWDERMKRVVALKIVPLLSHDGNNTIQFMREATLITRLQHPHLLPLYDFGETEAFRYLVMRYVAGGSLAQRLIHQRLSSAEVLRLMIPIASTLDYLHEQNVVHRDLKPGNILIDAQGIPYLVDFGLAKSITDTTTPMHSMTGTLNYMPPEQFTGGVLSISSDQYSFGIMLFQLFTGKLPFDGQIALGMKQISSDEMLPDVIQIDPQLPTLLTESLWLLTTPQPEMRAKNASAILQNIASLFKAEVTSEPNGVGSSAFHITKALESVAYRKQEAVNVLHDNLIAWEHGTFTLSLTHYLLLNMLLPDLHELITSEVRSLMIRAQLEYHLSSSSSWWDDSSSDVQERACWHALRFGSVATQSEVLNQALKMPWALHAPSDIVEIVGQLSFPISSSTESALMFLDLVLPSVTTWEQPVKQSQSIIDNALWQLAIAQPNEIQDQNIPNHAARLIGIKRRTAAAQKLLSIQNGFYPLMVVYESANGLPAAANLSQRAKIVAALALRQLTKQPKLAIQEYLWTALGNSIAFALIIWVIGAPRFLNQVQLLNQALSYGLIYGLLLGVGVWVSRHISQRLQVFTLPIRLTLAMLVGGIIVSMTLVLFNRIALDNSLDGGVALYSGLLYVGGFALGSAWRNSQQNLAQWLLGIMGIVLALLIPWMRYLQNDEPPVIDFGGLAGSTIVMSILVTSLLVTAIVLGQYWIPSKGAYQKIIR